MKADGRWFFFSIGWVFRFHVNFQGCIYIYIYNIYIYIYKYLCLCIPWPFSLGTKWLWKGVNSTSLAVGFIWHPLEGAGIKNIVGYHRLSKWWLITDFFEIHPCWYLGKWSNLINMFQNISNGLKPPTTCSCTMYIDMLMFTHKGSNIGQMCTSIYT